MGEKGEFMIGKKPIMVSYIYLGNEIIVTQHDELIINGKIVDRHYSLFGLAIPLISRHSLYGEFYHDGKEVYVEGNFTHTGIGTNYELIVNGITVKKGHKLA